MSDGISVVLFRILFFGIFFGLQIFLYRKAVGWAGSTRGWRVPLLRFLFLWFNLPALAGFLIRPDISSFPPWFLYTYLYPFFVWHGATLVVGLVLVISLIIKTPFRSAWWLAGRIRPGTISEIRERPAVRRFNLSRRRFLRSGTVGLTAVSFGGAAYGLAFERSRFQLITREIVLRGLPDALDGFQIAMISDTHSGPFMGRSTMEEVARMTNDLNPDLILVTGDFVNSRLREVYPFAEAFSALSAPHGVYGVLGNHDFYTGEVDAVAREVEEAGIVVLRNRAVTINRHGSSFSLAGIDDAGSSESFRRRVEVAYEENPSEPRILMSHRPYFLPAAHEYDVALMLSGHTHGGQVVLGRFGPTTIAPAAIASGYIWGEYSHQGTRLYVNRGIGTVGLPIRLNCPPEITRIILRAPAA